MDDFVSNLERSIRILLVDDHTAYRQSLRLLCEVRGHFLVIGEAADGRQAIKLASQLTPDVILMDINLPECNGSEAARKIMQAHPGTCVIMLTMYPTYQGSRAAEEAGAAGYLGKNTDADTLIRLIEQVFDGSAHAQEIWRTNHE